VVVLVMRDGERTMLTDRASAIDLVEVPDPWLADARLLHLPAYSLVVEPLGSTALAAAARVREAGALISIDASSVRALATFGPTRFVRLLDELAPDVLLANEEEAALLGLHTPTGADAGAAAAIAPLVIVKRGGRPAMVLERGRSAVEVPARSIDAVADTTGAGDAFAAGLLVALAGGAGAIEATAAGHELASAVLGQPGAALPAEVA
jgi:sugar/nucleoside kinase (ribokinase family)